MIARTMAVAAADPLASHRPLLFLDTCDLVNPLQDVDHQLGDQREPTQLSACAGSQMTFPSRS
jgi:hypothetical protein